MSSTKTFTGLLSLHSHGEAEGILFLSSLHDPLAEALPIGGKTVTIRYWISDAPATRDQLVEDTVRRLSGSGKTDFGSRYSEWAGYLWTEEEMQVGGHDLLQELKSHVGKWLFMEIEIH